MVANQLLVEGLVLLGRGLPAKRLAGASRTANRFLTPPVVSEQSDAGARERLDVLRRHHFARAELSHGLPEAADIRGDDRKAVPDPKALTAPLE